MTVDARTAEETIWLGAAAYGADPRVQVGDRWFATGLGYPGLNGVFPAGPVDVDAALAPFRARGLPMLWHLGPAARPDPVTRPGPAARPGPASPAGLVGELAAAGCRFYEEEPLMVATTGPPTPPVPAGLVVVEATTPEQLADFARVWSGGAGRAAIADLARLRSAPAFTNLLGLLDGVPVATAAAFHGPVAGEVQHVVTMAAARRRGIGAVLTAAAWAAIRGRGASAAVLTASPDGEGIYRRLGFRTVGTVRRYQWRPAW